MEFAQYEIPPGGASLRGASYTPWFTRGAWNPPPDVETNDPHPDGYSIGDGPPAVGPLPDNITGGGDFPVNAEFADNSALDFGPIADNIFTD